QNLNQLAGKNVSCLLWAGFARFDVSALFATGRLPFREHKWNAPLWCKQLLRLPSSSSQDSRAHFVQRQDQRREKRRHQGCQNKRGEQMISRELGLRMLVVVTIAMLVVDLMLPRIPQPQSYHAFADQRSLLGVSHFADVVSNAPFAIFGLWGLILLQRYSPEELRKHFLDRRERWFYVIISIGLLLTAFGSGYYHLDPDNDRLMWDRLPMTIVFMSLVAALIAERISLRVGLWLLPVLLVIGISSVVQWHLSEMRGAGDLRFYGTVQAYSVIFVLLALLFPTPYTHGSDLLLI